MAIMSFNAASYLFSSLNSDEVVSRSFPASTRHFLATGYTRKLTDFGIFLINAFIVAILLPKQQNLVSSHPWSDLNARQFQTIQIRNDSNKNHVCKIIWFTAIGTVLSVTSYPLLILIKSKSIGFILLVLFYKCTTAILATAEALPFVARIYLISFYFRIRIKKLKALLHFNLITCNKSSLKNILIAHNTLCKDIATFSKKWKVFYFLALFSMIPISLIMLHSLLFGDLPYSLIFPAIMAFLISSGFVFVISYLLAQVSYRIHCLKKTFFKIIFNVSIKKVLKAREWLKFMSTLERMSTPNRKIGFTCLTIFTVTYAALMKVSQFI